MDFFVVVVIVVCCHVELVVALRSKALVFGQTVLNFVGSSPTLGWFFCCCAC